MTWNLWLGCAMVAPYVLLVTALLVALLVAVWVDGMKAKRRP